MDATSAEQPEVQAAPIPPPDAPPTTPEPEPPEPEGPPAPALDPSGDPAPQEVENDIYNELDKFDAAVAATHNVPPELPATQPQDPLSFDASFGLTSPTQYDEPTAVSASRHAAPAVLRTLDDLYARFPKIGDGTQYLNVERRAPASARGRPCRGWICDLHEPINMEDFRQRFGGGTYVVRVMGPQLTVIDNNGDYRPRTLGQVELVIAGEPRFPEDEEKDVHMRSFAIGRSSDAEVEKTRLQLEHRERERQDSRADVMARELAEVRAKSGPDWALINQMAEARAEEVRALSAESLGQLRVMNDKLQGQLEARDRTIQELRAEHDRAVQELREKLLEVKQEAARVGQQQETTRITELKEQHEREVRRLERDYAEKIDRITTEHTRAMDQAASRHDKERNDLIAQHERERSSLRDEASRRETQLFTDHKMREEQTRAMYESRIAEADRAAQREIRSVKESYQQQFVNLQSTESTKATLASETARMQVAMAAERAERAERSADMMNHELETARRELHQSPLEAVTKSKQLLETLGMKVAGQDGEETPSDWKTVIGQTIRNVFDKAPEIARSFGEAREQNRAAAVHAQQTRQAAAMRQVPPGYQPAPPAIAPPGEQPGQPGSRRAHRAPPPGMARPPDMAPPGAPPPYKAAPPLGSRPAPIAAAPPLRTTTMQPVYSPIQPEGGPPIPDEGASADNAMAGAPVGPPMPAPPDYAPPVGYPPMPVDYPPPPAPPAEAPQQQQQPPPPPPPPQEQALVPVPAEEVEAVAIDPEQVNRFVREVEDAIKGSAIPASLIAQRFVEEAGVDVTRALIAQIPADQFLAMVEQTGGGNSVLLTRRGRQYVAELWHETAKIVG